MGDLKIKNPDTWNVRGNIAPKEVSAPSSTTVFTPTNTSLTIEDSVIIDGNRLIPVKSVPNW